AVEKELLRALDKDPAKRHKTAVSLIEAVKRGYQEQSQAGAKPAAALSVPKERGAAPVNEELTIHMKPDKPRPAAGRRHPAPLALMIGVMTLIAGAFIAKGFLGTGGSQAAEGGAP